MFEVDRGDSVSLRPGAGPYLGEPVLGYLKYLPHPAEVANFARVLARCEGAGDQGPFCTVGGCT